MKPEEEVIHDHERFRKKGKDVCPHCGYKLKQKDG